MTTKKGTELTTFYPEPGDFCCVKLDGATGWAISLGEKLNGGGFSEFDHVLGYVGNGEVIQTNPGGAKKYAYSDVHYPVMLWSTGHVQLTSAQRTAICEAAYSYLGTGYSAADYFALAAHHLHLPGIMWDDTHFESLRTYIGSSNRMICSQYWDRCYEDAGIELFTDNRWDGYVTPADMAAVIRTGYPSNG
jgi:hypothetical protein